MFQYYRFLLFLLLTDLVLPAAAQEPLENEQQTPVIRIYNEISAPFYWLDEEGNPQGVNHDLANELMAHTNLNATVEHLPWAQAFKQAVNQPNVVLMSVLRTPSRESQFQWLGIVDVARASFMKLTERKDIHINRLEDAKGCRVGTIRGYGSANFLLSQGFEEFNNLTLVTNTEQLWSMLYKGRIDLVLANPVSSQYEAIGHGLDPTQIESIYTVPELHLA